MLYVRLPDLPGRIATAARWIYDVLWNKYWIDEIYDALVVQRPLWAQTRLWMFGHAALEKLVQPYKSITVHLWRVPEGVTDALLDGWLGCDSKTVLGAKWDHVKELETRA